MKIIVGFTENGAPKTGLNPTMDIWESDGTHVINAAAMTEIAGGGYFYNFVAQVNTKDYFFRADGGAVLADHERYQSGSNTLDQVNSQLVLIKTETDKIPLIKTETDKIPAMIVDITLIKKVESRDWEIVGNQMIFYDDDGTTPILTFDLKDSSGNPTMADVFKREKV